MKLDLRKSIFQDARPMSGQEFLALETTDRVELHDGSLFISPPPDARHQRLVRQIADHLSASAERAALRIRCAVKVRLHHDRIVTPDLLMAIDIDADPVVDAAGIRMI